MGTLCEFTFTPALALKQTDLGMEFLPRPRYDERKNPGSLVPYTIECELRTVFEYDTSFISPS